MATVYDLLTVMVFINQVAALTEDDGRSRKRTECDHLILHVV